MLEIFDFLVLDVRRRDDDCDYPDIYKEGLEKKKYINTFFMYSYKIFAALATGRELEEKKLVSSSSVQ